MNLDSKNVGVMHCPFVITTQRGTASQPQRAVLSQEHVQRSDEGTSYSCSI